MFSKKILSSIIISVFLILNLTDNVKAQTSTNWYMAGASPQRTSWITDAPTGIAGITWYRPIEAYIDQKTQMITANGKVYVSTSKGLIVLNAENGNLMWRFDTEMPLGQSPTVVGDIVYVPGLDGRIYALRDLGTSSQTVWTFSATAGFSANPLVINNTLYIGSRDGFFYAINTANGSQVWKFPSGGTGIGPIMLSAAYDNGTIYFAGGDNYGYAVNASNGSQVWKTPQKLPGERYQSWWPVVYDNYVIFSVAPGYKNEANPGTHSFIAEANLKTIYRDGFYGTTSGASGNSLTSNGSQGWTSGLSLLDTEASPVANTLQGFIDAHPQMRVYAVINKSNGSETLRAPFMYTGTYSGNVYPPIINPNTNAIYAKNLISGTGGSGIARGKLMGWKPGNRYLHQAEGATWAIDEPQGYAGAGTNTYYVLCCDRAAGIISGSSWWNYGGSMLEQILPSNGAPNSYDPMWQKYGNALERLQSYYNGDPRRTNGSESRNGVYNSHGLQNPPIPYKFTNSSGQTVSRVFVHRSNAIIALGTSASETPLPLIEINTNPSNRSAGLSSTQLRSKLEFEIDKIIDVYDANPANGFLNPGYYNDGSGGFGLFGFYFTNPGDSLWAIASAYPLINDSSLKTRLSTYLQNFYNKYFGSTPISSIGWTNQPRESMQYPPEVANSMNGRGDTSGFVQRSFYGLWKYAQVFPSQALSIYNSFRPRLTVPSNLSDQTLLEEPYKFNEQIAAYQGFLALQEIAFNGNYPSDAQQLRNTVQTELNNLMSRRTQQFQKDHPWIGEVDNPSGIRRNNYTRQYNLSRNFLYLTKELGDYIRQNNFTEVNNAINEYTYLGPFWFAASNDNAFQEGVKTNLYDKPALFAAKAFVQQANQNELSKYVDTPTFERGDLYYIQSLVTALNASGGSGGTDTPTPTQPPVTGDANGDGKVDGQDYVVWLNHYNTTSAGPTNGDFNNSGRVDGVDFVLWLTHILF